MDFFVDSLDRTLNKIKKNMQNSLIDISDKVPLKKRRILESVGSILKNICTIEHSKYRNSITLLNNVCSGLIAYTFRENILSI